MKYIIQNEVNDLTFSTKFIMKTVKEKNDVRDQEEWYDELFTDRGNQNGNKLRTYRQFKQIRCTETYVSRLVHRPYRRAMALFRPFRPREAHHEILETVLVSSIRINLHKSLTQEIRCLLTNDNQPISPRVEMFEVFFPTDEKYLQALFSTNI
jgi:hypothetical protein